MVRQTKMDSGNPKTTRDFNKWIHVYYCITCQSDPELASPCIPLITLFCNFFNSKINKPAFFSSCVQSKSKNKLSSTATTIDRTAPLKQDTFKILPQFAFQSHIHNSIRRSYVNSGNLIHVATFHLKSIFLIQCLILSSHLRLSLSRDLLPHSG